jgi:uncharacterized protein (DUF58 family)
MRLLPTALGAKGALFFAVVLLLFCATPYSNLFFMLTAFLAVLGALGCAGAWTNLRGVHGAVVSIDMAPAGGRHEVVLRLSMPARRRCHGLAAYVEIGGRRHHVGSSTVAADGHAVRGEIEGLPRGVHAATSLLLRSRHPFGICVAQRREALSGVEVVAHPQPADRASGGALVSDAGSRALPAGGEAIAGLRDWRTGDQKRDVHWRATARRGSPVVKEYEVAADKGLEVVVDRRCAPAAFETALATAARCLLDARAHKRPLRLRSQGVDLRLGGDPRGCAAGLRWLAAASPLPADAGPPPASPGSLWLPRRGAEAAHA